MLGYIASVRNNSRKNDIVHLVSSFFTGPVIENAKKVLWEECSGDILGLLTRRKNTEERTSQRANVEDILDALGKLDEASSMPIFAVISDDLNLIPKVKPGELAEYSVVDRLSSLEDKVNRLCNTVATLSNENAALKERISRQPVTAAPRGVNPWITVTPPTPPCDPVLPSVLVTSVQSRPPAVNRRPPLKENMNRGPGISCPSGNQASAATHASAYPMPDDGSDGALRAEDPEFVLPPEQQKRIERAKRRRQATVFKGKGDEFRSLGGVEANRDIYVYRVCKAATLDDLKDFAKSEAKLDVKKVSLVSDPEWDTQSFRLSIPASQLDTALNAPWPAGICVRRWHFSSQKRDAGTGNSDDKT